MIRISAGTAHVLGLKKIKTDALPTTAYIMKGEGCSNDCGFCAQARNSSSRNDLLSRVTWPLYTEEEVLGKLGKAFDDDLIKRACFQVVDSRDVFKSVKQSVTSIKNNFNIPVCVSCHPKNHGEVGELLDLGVDKVSLPLDAACERVYTEIKTGSWQKALELIITSSQAYPGRISTHLICGLGETEEEMIEMIKFMKGLGVTIGLFAFTPIPGTKMAGKKQPPIDSYRRIQAAHHLLEKGYNGDNFLFNEGRLVSFGTDSSQAREILSDGEAFRTTGCPHCNRPYYNEKPGGIIYNYPRPLTKDEAEQCITDLNMDL